MNSVTITAVVSSKCAANSVGYQTDPVITEEIMKEAQLFVNGHSTLRLSLDGVTVIVSGSVFPPSKGLVDSTAKILSDAHDTVIERHNLKAANHKSLVDQYVQAYSLPVVE